MSHHHAHESATAADMSGIRRKSKGVPISAPQQLSPQEREQFEEDFSLPTAPFAARPSTSQSSRGSGKSPKFSPYQGAGGAKSVTNVGKPGRNRASIYSLKAPSLPSLGALWGNGSSPNLAPPPLPSPINTQVRPGTSVGAPGALTRPLDAHLGNSLPSPASITSPVSPQLTLNLPSDGYSLFGDDDPLLKPPEPLRIRKQASAPNLSRPKTATGKPPSPPSSIRAGDLGASAPPLERPILPYSSEERPSSSGSGRYLPVAPRGSQETTRSLRPAQSLQQLQPPYGSSSSIPTPPPSVPRDSHETTSSGSFNRTGDPVIQNVKAKRETLTISSGRKRSIEMKLEAAERANLPGASQRNQFETQLQRPPPLNLNLKPASISDRSGLRSAPMNRPPPSCATPTRPIRHDLMDDFRSQSAADIFGRHPDYDNDDDDHDSHRDSQTSSNYDFERPDSPMMPVTGPLASPFIPPRRENDDDIEDIDDSEDGYALERCPPRQQVQEIEREGHEREQAERIKNFKFPMAPAPPSSASTLRTGPYRHDDDVRRSQSSRLPAGTERQSAYVAPLSLKRSQTAPQPEESCWPLPPPTKSPAASAFPALDLDFDLEPPMMPAAMSDLSARRGSAASSGGSRVRSFSRPLTPSNEPLKFDTAPNPAVSTSPANSMNTVSSTTSAKMSSRREVVSPALSLRRDVISPPPPRLTAPPPRPARPSGPSLATTTPSASSTPPARPRRDTDGKGSNGTELGLRSPTIVGDDFGGGFI